MKVSQPFKNKNFVKYDYYVERKGKQVTKSPVYFGLVKGIAPCKSTESKKIDEKAAASVIKYKHPTNYQVIMKESYFNRNQNNHPKIKKILSHEVAHIKYNTHGPAWRRTAKKLGAAEYATPVGTLKKRRGH